MDLEITNESLINIVPGYSKKVILEFTEEEILAVTSVKFVCKELSICEDMIKDGNTFYCIIPHTVTETYTDVPLETTYNFNVIYNDENTLRGGFNSGVLVVEENNNPNCEV